MEESLVKKYLGKKVYLILDNGFRYTAKITNIESGGVEFLDKFGVLITISCSSIKQLTSIDNGWGEE